MLRLGVNVGDSPPVKRSEEKVCNRLKRVIQAFLATVGAVSSADFPGFGRTRIRDPRRPLAETAHCCDRRLEADLLPTSVSIFNDPRSFGLISLPPRQHGRSKLRGSRKYSLRQTDQIPRRRLLIRRSRPCGGRPRIGIPTDSFEGRRNGLRRRSSVQDAKGSAFGSISSDPRNYGGRRLRSDRGRFAWPQRDRGAGPSLGSVTQKVLAHATIPVLVSR